MKSSICEYFPCNVAKISGRNCAGDYKTTCQTYKFYQRYPNLLEVNEGKLEKKLNTKKI